MPAFHSSETMAAGQHARQRSHAAELARLLDHVRDPEIGLIRFLAEVPLQASEPDLYIAVAEFQDPFCVPPRSLSGQEVNMVTQSSGAALDRVSALWATVAEAIERFALHVYDSRDLQVLAADQLDGDYLSPGQLILYSDEQYARADWPFKRFDQRVPIAWTRGVRLDTGASVHIPASLVFLGYGPSPAHERFDSGYSTGAAAGPSFAEAALAGLLEVVERDAFACHWYLRRTPALLDREHVLPYLPSGLVRLLERARLEIELLDITTNLGIPAVLALGRTRDGCGVPIGASARLSLHDAVTKATIEAFHTFNWILDLRRQREPVPTRVDIHAYRDHVRYYLEPTHAESLAFLRQSDRPQPFSRQPFDDGTPAQRLDALVAHLASRGHRCFAVDITPDEVVALGTGLRVVKTFVTGLHPLGCGHDREHLDPRRLQAFAQAAGLGSPSAFNTDPHPFP